MFVKSTSFKQVCQLLLSLIVALCGSFLSPYPLLQVPIRRVISALGLSVPTIGASLIITDAMVKMTVEIKVMV